MHWFPKCTCPKSTHIPDRVHLSQNVCSLDTIRTLFWSCISTLQRIIPETTTTIYYDPTQQQDSWVYSWYSLYKITVADYLRDNVLLSVKTPFHALIMQINSFVVHIWLKINSLLISSVPFYPELRKGSNAAFISGEETRLIRCLWWFLLLRHHLTDVFYTQSDWWDR